MTEIPDQRANLVFEPNVDAPAELQRVSARYWQLDGYDDITWAPKWTHATRSIGADPWSGSPHYAAAAGGVFSATDLACATCDDILTLSSRTTLTDALSGKPVQCRRCARSLDEQAARILDPKAAEARQRRAEKARAGQEKLLAAQEQHEARRRAIAARFGVFESENVVPDASFVARVAAMAVIVAADTEGGLVRGIPLSDGSVAPSHALAYERLLVEARAHGLFEVHPSSPEAAFMFDGIDLTDSWYPGRAHYYSGGLGNLPSRLENLASDLREWLVLEDLTTEDGEDLQLLVRELIAAEMIRYFAFQITEHRLPDPNEKQHELLQAIAEQGAAQFALGHLYSMAWTAARDASSAYQRNRGMPAHDAVTYGVKQLQRLLQRFIDGELELRQPYSELKKFPLSATTTIVFHQVMGMNPMSTTWPEAREAIAEQVVPDDTDDDVWGPRCTHAFPKHTELMEWMRTSARALSDGAFRRALALVEDEAPDSCGLTCDLNLLPGYAQRLGDLHDKIVARTGPRDADVVVAEATLLVDFGSQRADAVLHRALSVAAAEAEIEPPVTIEPRDTSF